MTTICPCGCNRPVPVDAYHRRKYAAPDCGSRVAEAKRRARGEALRQSTPQHGPVERLIVALRRESTV